MVFLPFAPSSAFLAARDRFLVFVDTLASSALPFVSGGGGGGAISACGGAAYMGGGCVYGGYGYGYEAGCMG